MSAQERRDLSANKWAKVTPLDSLCQSLPLGWLRPWETRPHTCSHRSSQAKTTSHVGFSIPEMKPRE